MCAWFFLNGADRKKYGSAIKNWASQFSNSDDKYPRDLERVMDVFNAHPWDNSGQRGKSRDPKKNDKNKDDGEPKREESSFAQKQSEMICYCCGKKGHGANVCAIRHFLPFGMLTSRDSSGTQ